MSRTLFDFMAVISCLAMTSQAGHALTLAESGRTRYRIVVASGSIAPERTAAYELRDYLKQVTGAAFEIVNESEAKDGSPRILVGPSETVKALAGEVDWPSLGSEGIVIKTAGNDLLLAGGRPRGTLYAVYTFLEDVAGCRWWTSSESTIASKPTLTVPDLNITYTPKLRYREAFYRDPIEKPEFAARLKLNGHFYPIPPQRGGHYSIIGWCHTFFGWVPPDKHFAAHPEWYSEINGKRTAAGAQLCLTNDECRREMTHIVLEQLRRNPTAGIISVAQNDCGGQCQCAKCKAVEQEEGSPSGPLIRFVNAVAEEVEKEFPDALVETLAYQYTRKPPLHAKPRRNVIVRLCSIECSFTQPLTAENNHPFADDIRGWKAISPNLFIWDYVTNFANYLIPHPNLRVLAPNLRFFVENNVVGVFEQGDSATTIGDFVRLRAWLFAHLEWDPSRDPNALVHEFVNGYYGAAGPHIEAYLNLVHDSCERAKAVIGCYHQNTDYLGLRELNEAQRLFDRAAKAVAGDPILAQRVRRERMPLDHIWLLRHRELGLQARREKQPFLGPRDGAKACDEFIRLAREWDARNYSEGQSFESYVVGLSSRFAPPAPPPAEFAKLPKVDVVDVQENEFTLFDAPAHASLVDDPTASNGKAARMPATHGEWAIQYHITDEIAKRCPGEWDFYIIARCDATAKTGTAFRYGLYSNLAHAEVVTNSEMLESAADGKYHAYYLGKHKPTVGLYFWVSPVGNSGEVKGIFVDRVVLVRAKKR